MSARTGSAVLDPAELYERDFYAWTRQQARELRRLRRVRSNTPLDLVHLAEEIEDLGNEVRNAVMSQLERLIEHLLKLEHSRLVGPRGGWANSVDSARGEIARRWTPTIARKVRAALPDLYRRAMRRAARSLLDHPEPEAAAALPETCPYTLEQLLDDGWYPANRHGLPSPEAP
ncbi:MAG: DUF29 domain-containing protein [Geminicoccaceae bacterium]|nr:DUF29 domain-containing protein [Geminicoccaceae bacterium]